MRSRHVLNVIFAFLFASFSAFAASDLGLISLTGNTPERVIANPVTNKFYVTTVSGSLYEIDGSSLQALALSTGGTTINGYESIALDVASNRVFAVSTTGSTNDKFVLFDRNTNSFTSIKDYGTTEDPSSVLVNPSNGKIFVGYYNSTSTACAVDVFDAGLGAPVTRVLGGTTAETVRGMALNLVNNKVYVITTTKVFELDGTTGVIGNSATGLTNLHDVVFNPVSSKIYVSDNATDTVSIYNTSLGLITSVSVGDRAAALSVNTNANVVFVSNFGTNSPGFCMIDGASNAVTPFNVPGTFQYSGFTINHVTNEVYLVSAQEGVEIRNGSNGNVIRTLSSIGRKGSSINPVTNRLAVAESGGVRILDVSTHAASTIAAGTGPSALAVNRATNRVHVVNTGDNTVTIRNCDAAHSLVGTANVGTQPVAIAINEATGNVYVVNKGSNTVSVYNESAPGTVATINVGNTPVAVAVNTVTNKAYVVNQSNGSLDGSISVIDGATNTVRKTVTIGKKPEAIIVNAIRNRIFAISSNDDKLWVLEGGTDEFPTNLPGGSVTVGSQPMALAQSTQNERVFTANQLGNNITIVDGVDFTNNGNTGIGTPRAIIYNPNNDSIYVGLQSNDIVRASASNLISQNTINVGASTTALALDVNSNRLYAAASNGSLNIIQCATNTSTSISVGSQTPAIAVNPLAGTVYAVNSGSNDLTVLDMQNEVPRNMTVTASLTTPATNNIVFTQTPSISFSVSSSLIAGINPTRVYYQVDSTKGRWNSVTLSGGGPFTASDILPTQTDGTHILYCFAVDGQHVVNDDGFGADDTNGNSPNIGPISTLTFTVQNNNQPTLDPLNNGQQLTIREDVFTSNFSTVSLTGISAGNANEGAQVLSLSANLIQNQDAVINATTVEIINFSGSTATLRFKTTQDAFNTPGRKATIRVTLNDNGAGRYDGPKTIVRDLDIVVIPANDPPVVVSPPNNSVFNINEDAGTQTVNITGVDIGPSNEADTDGNGITEQFVQDIVAFSSDTSIIPHPVIDQHNPNLKTARMTYTPVANKSGTVTITLRVRDNGPDGGGFDVREANFTYTVNIAAVNDAPTVAPVADLTINEDAAQHTVSLTGITIGALEAGQTLTFAVASSNTALIPTPNLTDDGGGKATLTFTPVANTSGTSTITVTITDNGSGTAPNVNQIVETFDVIVNAVNDAPSFTKGPDFTVTEAGVQTSMANWATNFVFGPADEATQTVKQFNLTPDKPEFFAVAPAINTSGTLTFTPGNNVNAAVTVTVSVVMQDSGGTANGGTDLSVAQSFTISMTPLADSLVVKNTLDSGANSLRDCMQRARSGDTITFDPDVFDLTSSNAATVINVESELPAMDDGNVVIDASDRRVTINGSGTASACGIVISSSNNTVRGLNIIGFPKSGVCIKGGASNNIIGGNRNTGSGPNGQGLRLSGNGAFGLEITDAGTNANIIKGCWIGLDPSGKAAEPNLAGILIQGGAAQNIIGGTTDGEGNAICGNKFEGITFSGSGTDDNTVTGNLLGVAAVDDTVAARTLVSSREDSLSKAISRSSIGNGSAGVFLSRGTKASKVGGDSSTEGNVVANNGGSGVEVRATDSRRNAAKANRISRNLGKGIALFDNANDGVSAPVISKAAKSANSTALSSRATAKVSVEGTSSGDGTVEIFTDPGSQGGTLAGKATSTGGVWSAEIDVSDLENITATFTDASGNTSPFTVFGRATTGGSATPDDADGDGISNTLETLAGTDPNDPAAAPKSEGAVVADKVQINIGFLKTGKDLVKATMRLLLPENYVVAGSTLAVSVAGVSESFATFDSKGMSPKGQLASLKIAGANTAAGPAVGGQLTFSVKGKDLRAALASGGLTEKTTINTGEQTTIPLAVAIKTATQTYVYVGTVQVLYKATQGKTGRAKK